MADPKCFIIMPITTHDGFREKYRDGAEHFQHVLHSLLIPAVEKAKFVPIPPAIKGADVIQAEIVKKLETADLVLCDMSTLNPNVFFEWGIRTALNKPVCVVRDELTEKVPFDTGLLNHLEYKSTLNAWDIATEIDKIATHIQDSATSSKGTNPLWKYFGAKSDAVPAPKESGVDGKLDLMFMQLDAMRQKVDSLEVSNSPVPPSVIKAMLEEKATKAPQVPFPEIHNVLNELIPAEYLPVEVVAVGKNGVLAMTSKKLPKMHVDRINFMMKKSFGREVKFFSPGDTESGAKHTFS